MTNEEFIEYIKTNKQLKDLIEQYNPYLVILGGSRSIYMNTDKSDWDIVMYCPNSNISATKNIIIENDRNLKCHVMISSVDNIIKILLDSINGIMYLHTITALTQGGLSSKRYHIIYEREKHPLFDLIDLYDKWIVEIAVYRLLISIRYELKEIYTNNNLMLSYKIYYHLLLAYDILTGSDSTALIKKFRLNVEKTEEDLKEFNTKINYIKNFYDNFEESKYEILKMKLEVVLNV